ADIQLFGLHEGDLVVQIAPLRRIPGWTAAARGAHGGTLRLTAVPIACAPLAHAALSASATGIEHGQLAFKAADHDLGGIALLALLVCPLACLQRALNVDLAPFAEETLCDITDAVVEDHDSVPLGAFLALAGLAIVPAIAGGES